jgi:hypothetical protein
MFCSGILMGISSRDTLLKLFPHSRPRPQSANIHPLDELLVETA